MQRLTGRVSKGNCARTVATRLLSRRPELRWSRALALEDVHPAGPRGTTRGANHDLRAGYCNTDSEGITGNRVGALELGWLAPTFGRLSEHVDRSSARVVERDSDQPKSCRRSYSRTVPKSPSTHAREGHSHLWANHVMQLVKGLALRRPAAAFRLAGHQLVDDRHHLLVYEPLALLL